MSIHLAIFGKPRYLGLLDITEPFPARGAPLVVETMRGTEMALLGGALSSEQEARYRASCNEDASDSQVKGGEPILQEIAFARMATCEDIDAASSAREEEEYVLVKARALLSNHNLPMKLVDVEYLLDRKKLFFYFTSEQRVDFRAYVRDLAKEFRTRIELRQIGVRDEAKTVKGIAPCGLECCCSRWLHRFTPICIKMVKEQNLALNPTKISGICGRLMCCMSYEHTSYGALWKSLPNPGSKIRTQGGNYILDGVELSSDSVRVRKPDGGSVLVPVGSFDRFREAVMEGREWEDPARGAREFGLFDERAERPARGRPGDRSVYRKRTADLAEPEKTAPGARQSRADDRRTPDPGVDGAGRSAQRQEGPSGAPVASEGVKSAKKRRRRKPAPHDAQGKKEGAEEARPRDADRKDQPDARRPAGRRHGGHPGKDRVEQGQDKPRQAAQKPEEAAPRQGRDVKLDGKQEGKRDATRDATRPPFKKRRPAKDQDGNRGPGDHHGREQSKET